MVPAPRAGSSIPYMKKSKPPDQLQADFKNKPFTSLKGLARSSAGPSKKNATSPVREKIYSSDEDDAALFLRAAEGAKRFGTTPDVHDVCTARKDSGKTVVHAPEDSHLFLTAVHKIGKTLHDAAVLERERDETDQRSPSSRLRRLKRGEIRISRQLDLHGFLREEALKQLELFITAACSGGEHAVLVITGKGINSPEGPVLQGAVADWLRNRGKGYIAEFSQAPRDLGGSGAFVVFLKQK